MAETVGFTRMLRIRRPAPPFSVGLPRSLFDSPPDCLISARALSGSNPFPSNEIPRQRRGYFIWRRRWDSNPRALADNRISSAARYDHFATSPMHLPGGSNRSADKCKYTRNQQPAQDGNVYTKYEIGGLFLIARTKYGILKGLVNFCKKEK